MRRRAAWFSLPILIFVHVVMAAPSAWAYCSTIGLPAGRQVAELQTSAGELCIELLDDVDEAPGHVENFLYYLDAGLLDGSLFQRFVPGFVMQGGQWTVGPDGTELIPVREGFVVTNEPCTPDIPIGNGNSICSVRGNEAYTVALAKQAGNPDSGTLSWFISLDDNREILDEQNGGFTVFGRLINQQSIETAERMANSVVATTPDLYWSGSRFGYGTITQDDQDFVLPVLEELPLLEIPPYASTDYGCLDMRSQATIVISDDLPKVPLDPNDPDAPEVARHIASAACGETVADLADWIPGNGSPGCMQPDRLALRSDTPAPIDTPDEEAIPVIDLPAAYVNFTCEQLLESDAQRLAWQQDFQNLLVEVDTATVRVAVPEPGGPAGAAATLGCLAWLRRRRAQAIA